MPTNVDDNSNNKKVGLSLAKTESLVSTEGKKQQQLRVPIQKLKKDDHSHKGQNSHSKKIEELDREQQILLIFKDKIITKGEMQINFMKFKIENAKKIELNPNN